MTAAHSTTLPASSLFLHVFLTEWYWSYSSRARPVYDALWASYTSPVKKPKTRSSWISISERSNPRSAFSDRIIVYRRKAVMASRSVAPVPASTTCVNVRESNNRPMKMSRMPAPNTNVAHQYEPGFMASVYHYGWRTAESSPALGSLSLSRLGSRRRCRPHSASRFRLRLAPPHRSRQTRDGLSRGVPLRSGATAVPEAHRVVANKPHAFGQAASASPRLLACISTEDRPAPRARTRSTSSRSL